MPPPPRNFANEANTVRALDFVDWASRSGWVRDVSTGIVTLPAVPMNIIDVRVPPGETWSVIEWMVTVLGDRGARLSLYSATPAPASKESLRHVEIVGRESTEYKRAIRRTLEGGTRFRVEAVASPILPGFPSTPFDPAKNQMIARWTFITLPWVE